MILKNIKLHSDCFSPAQMNLARPANTAWWQHNVWNDGTDLVCMGGKISWVKPNQLSATKWKKFLLILLMSLQSDDAAKCQGVQLLFSDFPTRSEESIWAKGTNGFFPKKSVWMLLCEGAGLAHKRFQCVHAVGANRNCKSAWTCISTIIWNSKPPRAPNIWERNWWRWCGGEVTAKGGKSRPSWAHLHQQQSLMDTCPSTCLRHPFYADHQVQIYGVMDTERFRVPSVLFQNISPTISDFMSINVIKTSKQFRESLS